ncbi:glycosyltransferase family 2 protein [Winogradskyella sediminis]|uniref:Glycosyltransferase involved in cell wall bisynthesis n=1 Tax=Winogradskyella sediminis TaxID=1382466 RepID=A0A1H1VGP9_9FLAO|nr:glycosyltransferase family 2 protein [Winogradskyella sediminis]SDS84057.1 Glycosyltransferase involved in cell wall bisynthesis [Winogradskyella sediminis]
MTKAPLVSIIIPTYNRAHLISETLDSVLAQTYQNWECIVVDDGSTDGTDQLMASYCAKDSRFHYHHRPDDRLPGGNAARNYGFELCKGEYVQWFDSDDLMKKTLIDHQLHNIGDNHKGISICLLDRYNEDFSKLLRPAKKHEIKYSIYSDFILRIFKANLQTTFFKKTTLDDYQFDEKLRKSQEVEFLQRVFRKNEENIKLSNEVLVDLRRHKGSITSDYASDTMISILNVKLILIEEFPDDGNSEVLNTLKYNYLNSLRHAFKTKTTSVYLKYLFKFKFLRFKDSCFLIILYMNYYLTNKGLIFYKKRIKKISYLK